MSRAFVRESDFAPTDEPLRRAVALPPGAPNYMTAEGAERLRRELAALQAERAALAAALEPDARAARSRLDGRLAALQQSVRTMQVLSGPPADPAVVRVGAWVQVREADGTIAVFRIVGVDEADAARNWIAWVSPVARTLLNARVGQTVAVQRPDGHATWEILNVDYN